MGFQALGALFVFFQSREGANKEDWLLDAYQNACTDRRNHGCMDVSVRAE